MSAPRTQFVSGFHGCSKSVAAAVLRAAEEFNDPYDTVRCPFIEGSPVFPNSNFFDLTHIQIAVRNPVAIISLFPISF